MKGNQGTYTSPIGYANSAHANSLSEFGSPFQLHHSKAWLLKREIPGFSYQDGMWAYPLFSCPNWSKLHLDLDELQEQLVSVSVVTDPFGEYDLPYLQACFKDLAIPFKHHFVIDLGIPLESFVNPHHQRNARKALRMINVEICTEPIKYLDKWDTATAKKELFI